MIKNAYIFYCLVHQRRIEPALSTANGIPNILIISYGRSLRKFRNRQSKREILIQPCASLGSFVLLFWFGVIEWIGFARWVCANLCHFACFTLLLLLCECYYFVMQWYIFIFVFWCFIFIFFCFSRDVRVRELVQIIEAPMPSYD